MSTTRRERAVDDARLSLNFVVLAVAAETAIAVALMPPLCVAGLALSSRQWSLVEGAGTLFGTNFLGIALACMVVYIIDGRFGKAQPVRVDHDRNHDGRARVSARSELLRDRA